MKIPCNYCLVLPMCRNRVKDIREIKCSILVRWIHHYPYKIKNFNIIWFGLSVILKQPELTMVTSERQSYIINMRSGY